MTQALECEFSHGVDAGNGDGEHGKDGLVAQAGCARTPGNLGRFRVDLAVEMSEAFPRFSGRMFGRISRARAY
jgi:hypothetical protein